MTNINNLSEEEQIELVKEDETSIIYIDNPSEVVQLEAVKKFGYSIKYIKNPLEKVQLEAVKQNGWLIRHIKNPSEKAQIKAVKNLDYTYYDYNFVKQYITSEKALELYKKLKSARNIIK